MFKAIVAAIVIAGGFILAVHSSQLARTLDRYKTFYMGQGKNDADAAIAALMAHIMRPGDACTKQHYCDFDPNSEWSYVVMEVWMYEEELRHGRSPETTKMLELNATLNNLRGLR